MEFKQIAKSRTLNFNVFMPLVLVLLTYLGVEITAELTTAIMALGNILLRFVTKKPIDEK